MPRVTQRGSGRKGFDFGTKAEVWPYLAILFPHSSCAGMVAPGPSGLHERSGLGALTARLRAGPLWVLTPPTALPVRVPFQPLPPKPQEVVWGLNPSCTFGLEKRVSHPPCPLGGVGGNTLHLSSPPFVPPGRSEGEGPFPPRSWEGWNWTKQVPSHLPPAPLALSLLYGGISNPRHGPSAFSLALQRLPNQHSTHITLPCTTPLSPEDTGSVATATRVLPPTLFNNFSTVELGWLGAGEEHWVRG